MGKRPLVVLGDLHLAHDGGFEVSRDLARLVRACPGHEILLNGDTFNLSRDPPGRAPLESLGAMAARHHELRQALGEHLRGGSPLTLVAGNHDSILMQEEARAALLRALRLANAAPLHTAAWFVSRGGLHVEHGHVYDPDNAPTHPLARWASATEPLGVALTRRFVVPSGALHFAHAHQTTLAKGLLRSFKLYGRRAPGVVASYYLTAARLCLEAGRQPGLERERGAGERALGAFSAKHGISLELLEELVRMAPRPTHHRWSDAFLRLYLDRSLAAVLGISGAAAALGTGGLVGYGLAVLGGAYLTASVSRSGNRYAATLSARLRAAAQRVAELTGAKLVVFGHTHQADQAPRYVNPGSFAFSTGTGRSYVYVDENGEAEQRFA